MAMGVGGSGGGLTSDINVTPMIDVLLVLLVVFMLSMQLRHVLAVNVPPPVEQTARLSRLTEGGRRNLLFVKAAPRRKYREVVEAVDLARGAGWQIVGYMP